MADGILTTFSRHEIKYIVTDEQADAFLKALGDRVVIDRYCVGGKRYRINSVYYDTPTFLYARRSKQPDSKKYKEKIRIRSYDLPMQGEDSTVFPEFKKKVNGYCFKRRIYAPLNEARALFSGEMKPERDGSAEKQIAYELSQFVRLTPVVPAAYVKYKRMAFFDAYDSDIRFTLDNEIFADCGGDIDILRDTCRTRILPEGLNVLEIKVLYSMPYYAAEALAKCGIYRGHFSKYTQAYKMYTEGKIIK